MVALVKRMTSHESRTEGSSISFCFGFFKSQIGNRKSEITGRVQASATDRERSRRKGRFGMRGSLL